jgi:hypothetical protein
MKFGAEACSCVYLVYVSNNSRVLIAFTAVHVAAASTAAAEAENVS